MVKKSKRYFIMPPVWRTVTDSQVFNWVEILNEHDIKTDLISLSNIEKMQNKESVRQIEGRTGGRFYQYKLYPPIINDIVLIFLFLRLYIKDFHNFDKIIFQTRVASVGIPLSIIKLLPKVKTIFESRGATIEERKFVHGKHLNLKALIKEKLNFFSEKLLVKNSDGVICVSNALRDYYFSKFQIEKKRQKYLIVPGAASTNLFYFDEKLRKETREKLKYRTSDLVIVYSGALIQKWEIPEDVFSFVKNLKARNEYIFFLIITPDVEFAKKYSHNYNMDEYTIILNSQFDEVNRYLNAADIALLLREDILMNNVASPTKFAEYLLSGLPTIISKGVYDFADTIHNTNYGLVLENYQQVENQEFYKIFNLVNLKRDDIASWAKENLSKEKFINEYINFFDKI